MDTRSTFTILSLCLSTLFICVWNAVHHDVPFPSTPRWRVYLRRFFTFLVGLFLPELLVLNALEQFIVSSHLRREMRGSQEKILHPAFKVSRWSRESWRPQDQPQRWEMTHAFYAVMGGFVAKRSTGVGRVAPLWEGQIKALCQSDSTMHHQFAAHEVKDHSKAGAVAKALFCWQLVVFIVSCAARWGEQLPLSLLEITTLAHSLSGIATFVLWWQKPHSVDDVIAIRVEAALERHVYWPEEPSDDPVSDLFPLLGLQILFPRPGEFFKAVLSALGVACLYGLPHLLALGTEFPTLAERRCWQVATAIITGTPVCIVLLYRLAERHERLQRPITVIMLGLSMAYILASCFIVGESFRQLFALPDGAFISPMLVCYLPNFS